MTKKVILSRKGFDSSAGGKPSFIYGDRLISLPIPGKGSGIGYKDISFDQNTKLEKIMREVGIKHYDSECHLDPDIKFDSILNRHKGWNPAFGQADIAEKVLRKNNVGPGDIFLFYGWFKKIEIKDGKFKYIQNAPNLHIIFGFLEVDEVLDLNDSGVEIPQYLETHPHVINKDKYLNSNRLYVGKNAGTFHFNDSLVLTKKREKRSRWELPSYFEKEKFLGGTNKSILPNGNVRIEFVGRNNQEVLITDSSDVVEWAEKIIETNRLQSNRITTKLR